MALFINKLRFYQQKVACIATETGHRSAVVRSNLSITLASTASDSMREVSNIELTGNRISPISIFVC